jgi:hypothetical protein
VYEVAFAYNKYMANRTQAEQKPRPRKTMVLLTDDEWRAVRVAAAMHDTSVQGYLTQLALAALQGDDRAAMEVATEPAGQRR